MKTSPTATAAQLRVGCRVLDAPVIGTTSDVLKLRAVDHSSGLPTVFCRKNGQVALEDVRDVCTQQILPSGPYGLDEVPHEADVAAAVTPTFGRRSMQGRLSGAKIGHGELVHVTDDLAKGEMHAGLSVADQRGVSDHRERGGCA